MLELFVYAILCLVGFDVYYAYEKVLDKLFMSNPDNDFYLELECSNYKEAILNTLTEMNVYPINHDEFGKCLMKALKPLYEQSEIKNFSEKMYAMWTRLPSTIEFGEEPFFVFSYADDCLLYADEEQCRRLFESALNYYELNEQRVCFDPFRLFADSAKKQGRKRYCAKSHIFITLCVITVSHGY